MYNRLKSIATKTANEVAPLPLRKSLISSNPTHDFFIIEKKGTFDLEIRDATGKLFLEKNQMVLKKSILQVGTRSFIFLKIFEKGK